MASPTRLDEIVAQAKLLSTLEKVRLIEELTPEIERDLVDAEVAPSSRRSLWGLCRDLGSAPGREEIDAARREAWKGFATSQP